MRYLYAIAIGHAQLQALCTLVPQTAMLDAGTAGSSPVS